MGPPQLERTKGRLGKRETPHSATTLTPLWSPSLQAHTHCTRHSLKLPSPWVAPWGLAQTPKLLPAFRGAPASHLPLPFLLPSACLHPLPPLPMSGGCPPAQTLPARPWQSFPLDHPTRGRDDPGDGVAEGGLWGGGHTHGGFLHCSQVTLTPPEVTATLQRGQVLVGSSTDGHSRLRVHQAAGTATLEMASGWLSVSTLTCWKPLQVALCRCLFQSSSVSQNS